MMKEERLIHYKIAMSVFSGWVDQGILCEEELDKIEGLIAKKYNLPKGSIYREKTCY